MDESEQNLIEAEWRRPSVLFRPALSVVSDRRYRAAYEIPGEGLVKGYGLTPDEAMRNFDRVWMAGRRMSLPADPVRAFDEETRPCALFRPELSFDEESGYCALYGPDWAMGCVGFGKTPEDALQDFDCNWVTMPAGLVMNPEE